MPAPTLAPGNYVVRHETHALHALIWNKNLQVYPFCFNFVVTGAGTVKPKGVIGTKLYNKDEPAFSYDVFGLDAPTTMTPLPDYVIPGPPLWDGK